MSENLNVYNTWCSWAQNCGKVFKFNPKLTQDQNQFSKKATF